MCPIVVESENISQRKCGLHPSIVAHKVDCQEVFA